MLTESRKQINVGKSSVPKSYDYGCTWYKPSSTITSAAISLVISISEFILSIYEYLHSREGSIIAGIFTGIFAFHGLVSLLYFTGIVKSNECLQLPLLTAQDEKNRNIKFINYKFMGKIRSNIQLIFVSTLGLLVVVWWIATLLAVFDLVHYRSPFEPLSNSEFFIAAGIVLMIFFLVSSKVSLVLYQGYKETEKNNLFKKRAENGVLRTNSRTSTIPPSYV